MTDKLKTLIANLKHKPGVYLMHDVKDAIIYVGKAKDLQKRVSQYFLRPQSGKVFAMVSHVDYFETIITANEKEAFVLEMNLIHEHMPRYNIMLKDDSHYPYLALKRSGDPVLKVKRDNKNKDFIYYGPFPNAGAAYRMNDLVNKIFPIRKCQSIPSQCCLYYHLGQCLGPCINSIDESKYQLIRDEINSFLKGNNQKAQQDIKQKMLLCSEKQDFEMAQEYKLLYDAINHINTDQNVETFDKVDRDIFAYSCRNGYIALAMLLFRNGLLLGKKTWVVEEFLDNEEQVSELIEQYYSSHSLPKEIVINSPKVIENISTTLDVYIYDVTKGKLHELVLTAIDNANNALDEYFISARLDEDKATLLDELGKTLNIVTPYHIELFDNSHLQGSSPVGAMVAFVNGEPYKKLYRKFHIEHEESRDDLLSIKEVVYRHYSRSLQDNRKLPDLILVDGGLTAINAAKESLDALKLSINLFGLYKNDKHQTSGLMDANGNTYEINNKNLFFLLTRMQDEVHRFAISFHKDTRNKKMTKSILDDVKGLGMKRKEMIKKAYPDINLLKEASLEELSQFLPKEIAIELYNHLHN